LNSKKPANQAGIKNGGYIGDWVLNFSLEGLLSGVFPWEMCQCLLSSVFFSAGVWSWRFGNKGVDAVDLRIFGRHFKLPDALGDFVDLFIVFSNHFNQADQQLFD
jgi:hypothetical protein